MAYKFQKGSAVLSGSLTQEGQILAKESKISGSTIGLGDASGLAETGGGIEATGGKLELSIAGMTTATPQVATDAFFFAAHGGAAGNIRSGSFADLATAFAGNGIAASSGVLSVDTNGSSINNGVNGISVNVVGLAGTGLSENSGQLDVSSAQTGISSIKHNSLVIGRVDGNDDINFTDGSITIDTNNVSRITVVDASTTVSNNLIVSGDLTVNGTQTFVNTATLVVTSSIQFEGTTPDANEIILTAADAQGSDKTITLPDLTGHVPLLAGAISTANVTAAEFGLLDGATNRVPVTILDTDGFFMNDGGTMKHVSGSSVVSYILPKITGGDVHVAANGAATIQANAVEGSMLNNNVISGLDDINAAIVGTDELLISDNGTIRRTDMSRIKTYIGAGTVSINAIGDANGSLAVGVNAASDNASATRTWTLPASAGLSTGDAIIIKAYANAGTYPVTIACAGSQTIDDPSTTQIVLESNNAAVTLYYVDTDFFIIV
tara:strand:- start:2967 stop:4448 length:1482 start_codon:yes stop_codon:yes gene_type:complete